VEVSVSPAKLVFSEENNSLSYEISFTSKRSEDIMVKGIQSAFGSIEWSDGIHSVTSPIAVRWRYQSAVSM